MKKCVMLHDGAFPGLRIIQADRPVTGCSLAFLAFLHERTQCVPASRVRIDPDLQRLLTHYRECLAVERAA